MNKIWIIGDTHLGYKNDDQKCLDSMFTYLEKVIDKVTQDKSDIFVHLGDLYDRRTTIGLETVERSIKLFQKLKGMRTYILAGNHDTKNWDNHDISSLSFIPYINSDIKIIRDITEIEEFGKKLLFIPYYQTSTVCEKLKDYKSKNYDYCFSHLDFNGLKLNKATIANTELSSFDINAKYIFNGHIHLSQEINNIINVGSAYELTLHDFGNDKFIYCVDTSDNSIKKYRNRFSPRMIRVNYEDILEDDNIFETLKGNNVIVVIDRNKNIPEVPEIIQKIKNTAYSVTWSMIERERTDISKIQQSSGTTFNEKLTGYSKMLKDDEIFPEDDINNVEKVILDIYSNIKS